MTQGRAGISSTTGTGNATPIYVQGGSRSEVWAHFKSGAIVQASRSRARAYPGLPGDAPVTTPFYQALGQIGGARKVVLDLGAGSGEGARRLKERFERVIAVDKDARALAFCREHAPGVETLNADLEQSTELPAADAAVLCDTLGQLRQPQRALLRIRSALRHDSALLVAEPAAHASQALRSPQRRGYTKRSLTAAMLRAGFGVQGWLAETGSFLALLARPSEDEHVQWLARASEAELAGQLEEALKAWDQAAASPRSLIRVEALLGAAETRIALGDGDGAAAAYIAARTIDDQDGRSLAGLAHLALAANSSQDALSLALEAIRLEPVDVSAATALSLAAERLEHPDAYRMWRVTARLAPDDPAVVTQLARLSAERADYPFCINLFERLREYGDALGANFHVTLGWLMLSAARPQDAMIEARIATTLAPSDPAVGELWLALEQAGVGGGRG